MHRNIIEVLDKLVVERERIGIDDDQQSIFNRECTNDWLRWPRTFSSEDQLQYLVRVMYRRPDRRWLQKHIYSQVGDCYSTLVTHHDTVKTKNGDSDHYIADTARWLAGQQNSLHTIRKFAVGKQPYRISIWYKGRYDADNVAKWIIDALSNGMGVYEPLFSGILSTSIPVVADDRYMQEVHVYKNKYNGSSIPPGICAKIELID